MKPRRHVTISPAPVLTVPPPQRKLPWVPVIMAVFSPVMWFVGAMCNALVITANGGLMPSQWKPRCMVPVPDEIVDNIHTCMNHATHLKFLADWIHADGFMSPGDLLMTAGEWAFWPGLLVSFMLLVVMVVQRDA